jgi:D-amino peptidase
MKLFISSDIEGTAGVVDRSQLHGESGYVEASKLMANEINAAIRGAVSEGIQEIVVCDSHWKMRNVDPLLLEPVAALIQGDPRPLGMMQGIDDSYDAVFFTGYHAMAGTQGAVVDHTYYSGTLIQNVKYNGKSVGETTINGLLAAYHSVPVVLLTGDDKVTQEAQRFFPGIVTVVVKQGITRLCGKSLHPTLACKKIEEGAREAIKRAQSIKPPKIPDQLDVEVDFTYTTLADVSEIIPTTRRTGPRSICFGSSDYLSAFKTLQAVFRICESV